MINIILYRIENIREKNWFTFNNNINMTIYDNNI